ncbi:MAG: beta-lactamase family protein [Anaerolineales bacterium]|nr:beta-lactamase family protein [Anaerolineales bacterium]
MNWRIVIPLLLIGLIVAGILFAAGRLKAPQFADESRELDAVVAAQVQSGAQIRSCALAVMKGDGSFAWAGAAGTANAAGGVPMTADTPVFMASVTKLFTAAAVMRLYEKGELALDDPMAEYLPEDLIRGIHVYQGKDYSGEITVAQLLAQTSGIADYYDGKGADGFSMYEMFLADPERIWTVEETIARARDELKPDFAPGTAASYSDTNYQLLGKIIEAVTGKPLADVFDEYFFRPLEMGHTWLAAYSEPRDASAAPADVFAGDEDVTQVRTNGSYWADGGVVSTVKDSILFLKALREGRILRSDTLESMHDWRPLRNLPFKYGFGTMYLEMSSVMGLNAPPVWGHSGSNGSFLYYSEELDLYVAGTINQTEDRMTPFMLMADAMQAMG